MAGFKSKSDVATKAAVRDVLIPVMVVYITVDFLIMKFGMWNQDRTNNLNCDGTRKSRYSKMRLM